MTIQQTITLYKYIFCFQRNKNENPLTMSNEHVMNLIKIKYIDFYHNIIIFGTTNKKLYSIPVSKTNKTKYELNKIIIMCCQNCYGKMRSQKTVRLQHLRLLLARERLAPWDRSPRLCLWFRQFTSRALLLRSRKAFFRGLLAFWI